MRTFLVPLLIAAAPAAAGEGRATAVTDRYCGPRSAAVVLDALRPPGAPHTDLIEVIADLQPPGVRTETSLAELASFLESHGLAARPVRLPTDCLPDHDLPVILHLAAGRDGPGHFAVLRRAADGASVLDHGLTRESVDPADLRGRWTGAALLTARTVGELPPVAAAARNGPTRLLLFASAAVLLAAGGLLLRRRGPAPARATSDPSPV